MVRRDFAVKRELIHLNVANEARRHFNVMLHSDAEKDLGRMLFALIVISMLKIAGPCMTNISSPAP